MSWAAARSKHSNVPDEARWVALLNEPGYHAAYNAGQSGANSIDAYFTFEYLTKKGMKFDLVVLATGQNDLGWESKFEKYGHRFVVEEYKQGLHDYLVGEFGSNLTLDDWLRQHSVVYFLAAQARPRSSCGRAPALPMRSPLATM